MSGGDTAWVIVSATFLAAAGWWMVGAWAAVVIVVGSIAFILGEEAGGYDR